jgi:hypothetical protein
MQLLHMIWDGIGGLGSGTVLLKALFILFLGSLFWMICELIKYIINIFAKMVIEALRHLSIMVRGWPKNTEEGEGGDKSLHK